MAIVNVNLVERNSVNFMNFISNKKVLLVEDSPTQAEQIKAALEAKGLEVSIATTGELGLNLALQHQPNLVVLDVNLPGLNGFEVCGFLKNNLATRSTPVVMYSEENRLGQMTKAYSVGVDYYVTKDSTGERTLLAIIENLLERQTRRRRMQPHLDD